MASEMQEDIDEMKQLKAKIGKIEAKIEKIEEDLEKPGLTSEEKAQLMIEKTQLRTELQNKDKLLLALLRVKELLMMQQQAAGTGAGTSRAGVASRETVLAVFVKKLQGKGIRTPDKKVMRRIMVEFAKMLEWAGDPYSSPTFAVELYEDVKRLPHTTTRAHIAGQLNISLNGPYTWTSEGGSHHILSATDRKTGAPKILKVLHLRDSQKSAAHQHEEVAADKFDLSEQNANCLVHEKLVTLPLPPGIAQRPGDFHALIMRKYPATVASLQQMEPGAIVRGGQRMEKALTYIHGQGYTHNDVKASNVMVDMDGLWYLGDFGGVVAKGERITVCSALEYPADILGEMACEQYDYGMLVTMLVGLVKAGDTQFRESLQDKDGYMDGSKVYAAIKGLGQDVAELQQYCLQLIESKCVAAHFGALGT